MATVRLTHADPSNPVRPWHLAALLALGLTAYWLVTWWQTPPAVEFDNLKYIQLMRTAVSSERPDWVAKVREAIDVRFSAGEMSQSERSHFERVLTLADQQQWDEANQLCFEFEEAQLSRRRSRPASETHSHDHDH